jgi:hypothetical protein
MDADRREFLKRAFSVAGLAALYSLGISDREARAAGFVFDGPGGAFKLPITIPNVAGYLDNYTGFATRLSFNINRYKGLYATFTASSGNWIKFKIGGQSGSGETYGSNTITNPTFGSGGSGWNTTSGSITFSSPYAVFTSTPNGSALWQSEALTANALYLLSCSGSSFSSGEITVGVDNISSAAGGFTKYVTHLSGANGHYAIFTVGTTSGDVSSPSSVQVLTPSNGTTSGTFGSLFNGAATVTGSPFNASSYTVTITAS